MITSLVKKHGLPQDNPFGIWLSKFDFCIPSEAEQIAVVRGLPLEGPFYLFRPEWLLSFDAIIESRVPTSRGRKSGATARPVIAAQELVYGEQVTKLTSGGIERHACYEFRQIDDDCFFECLTVNGEPATGVDIAPYTIHLDDNQVNSKWNRRLKDYLLNLLTKDTSRSKERLVGEALSQFVNIGKDLIIIGFAVDCSPDLTLSSLWLKHQLSPGVWALRENIVITDRLVIDPAQPIALDSAESSIKAWADKILEVSRCSQQEARNIIVDLELNLTKQKRLLGSLNLIVSSTTSSLQSKFSALFERLRADSRVSYAGMCGSNILLRTNDVYVPANLEQPGGPRCFLGQYEFRVALTSCIKIRNLKLPDGKDRIHPHGYYDSVCLGTYSNTINNCLLSFDYYTLMLTLLEWTTDINPGDSRAVLSLGTVFKTELPNNPVASEWGDFVNSVRPVDEDEDEIEDEN